MKSDARRRAVAWPSVVRPLPTVGLAGATGIAAWSDHGSIAAHDWLPLAVLAALVVATIAFAGAVRPARGALAGVAGLALLAAWTATSAAWSPTPAGARDEALLTGLYAIALLVPLLTLPGAAQRTSALAGVVACLAVVGVLTAGDLALASQPGSFFFGGRLDFPVGYVNACAAFFALGFWPAVVLAARRTERGWLRAAALGAGGLFLALAVAAQSKGAVVGLAVSALVVFAAAPARLRLLVPIVLAAGPALAASGPLTAAYRSATVGAAHELGWTALAVLAAGVVLGAGYLLADCRVSIGPRGRRLAGGAVLAALAAAAAVAFASVDLGQKWREFKHPATGKTGSTHLASLGSNRYDFWRVAIGEAERHPLLGSGGRGFYTVYLQRRTSPESPLRAHSLYLDALSEEGVPGLLLLLVGIGAPLVLLVRRRARPTAVAALGAATYFFAHAGVDWIWTLPVAGVPAFLLVGIGCAGDDARTLPRLAGRLAGVAAAGAAVLAFAPPWLSYRYVSAAYRASNPGRDLHLARLLDPLSLEPDVARWRLAATPAARLAALESARGKEPDSVAVLYQLGLEQLADGRRAAAIATLERAAQLDPHEASIRLALRHAKG